MDQDPTRGEIAVKTERTGLEKLELTAENVLCVLAECRPTLQTEIIANASIYSRTSSRRSPIVQLDLKKTFTFRHLVRYWLGQLLAIHENKEKMAPGEGFINYKGARWTEDTRALLALYDLAITCESFPLFVDGEVSAETKDLPDYYARGLTATFAPSDPAFDVRKAAYALKEQGLWPVN